VLLVKHYQNNSPPTLGEVEETADPLFCFPTGPRAWRTSTSHTCDRVWRFHYFWRLEYSILRSLHVHLHLHQQRFCGNVTPLTVFEGELLVATIS
jgi:hypothetical protein